MKSPIARLCALALFFFFISSTQAKAAVAYVDSSVAVSGIGTSWTTAYKTLQEALTTAATNSAITQVWVRKGTYYPTDYPVSSAGGSSSRDYAFALKSSLAIYGGFAGTETAIGQRTIGYPTILSGDIGTPGSNADNCYHVVVAAGCNSTAILDGVTITAAYGNTIGAVTVAGTSLNRNFGGGLCVESSSPVITNCIFQGNATYYTAGGINSIAGGGGLSAGAAGGNSYPSLINCIFYANSASRYGGGVYCATNSSVSLTNCTVYGNSANAGGSGLYCNGGSLQLGNCIIWGNSSNGITNSNFGSVTASYSDVQDVSYSGTNNTISADPLFANTTSPAGADGIWGTGDDGLQPGCGSPAVNTGTASGAPAADLSGNPRPLGGGVDMGAYERYGSVVYVDSSRAVSGNGGSWATAYNTLSAALAAVQPCTDKDSILIAKGTYYPTGMQSGTNRDSAFVILRGGLKLYGGYPTGGGARNIAASPTILSGNIGSVSSYTDNSYHVVVIAGLSAAADSVVADGLTITSGNASGSGNKTYNSVGIAQSNGGGVLTQNNNGNTKMVLHSCTFSANTGSSGGGMYNSSSSSPAVSSCTFSANTANYGGGMYSNASSPAVSNCTFSANTGSAGGGMYNYFSSSPSVSNCAFSANTGSSGGGGMFNTSSSPAVSNCTFSANTGSSGGGMYNAFYSSPAVSNCTFSANTGSSGGGMYNTSYSSPAVSNCILWGNTPTAVYNSGSNPTVTYSDVQGGYTGTGNINADPLFVNTASPAGPDGIWGTADDGLQPGCGSPAQNTGSNSAIPAGITTDITGAPRIAFTTVDMGAYEEVNQPVAPSVSIATATGTACPGSPVTFTATPVNGGSTPAYQWLLNGAPISGATSATYSSSTLAGTDSLAVMLTGNAACSITATATSNKAGVARYSTVLYVDSSVAVSGMGGSWNTAFSTLSAAMAAAQQCSGIDSILIAKGTYYPTGIQSGTNRDSAFTLLRGGLKLYGGYPTGGGIRNSTTNPTVMSGNIGNASINTDNSYHVMVIAGLAAAADSVVVDGLTITGGNANGLGAYSYNLLNNSVSVSQGNGGGMVTQANNSNSRTVLRNCTFLASRATNGGGGLYNRSSSPAVSICIFLANTGFTGGGMENSGSSPAVTNCTFSANTCNNGGGMHNYNSSSPSVSNCNFSANTGFVGGGMFNETSCSPAVSNCTFSKNNANNLGGGIYNFNASSPAVSNCIFWGNVAHTGPSIYSDYSTPTVTYSDVQDTGVYVGTGNINADPLFVNPTNPAGPDGIWGTADDGLQLNCGSPAQNTGTATGAPATDITGTARPQGSGIDMGAYEQVSQPVTPSVSIAASTTAACPGSPVTFTATPLNGGNTPSYQWLLNGAPISGATNATYNSNATMAVTDSLTVVLTGSAACAVAATATSSKAGVARYGSIVYVDSSVAVSGIGGSWQTAFKTLSAAMAAAQQCSGIDSILIAKGTYYPTGIQGGTNRDSAFVILRGGLKLFGGYQSGGGARNVIINPTILSGNIGNTADITDNSYHVVVIAG